MVAIIDYDAGNIKSVEKAVKFLGKECIVTDSKEEILNAGHVILPGVGAFGSAMERLKERKLDETIKAVATKGTPFLGICLGLQLLFEESEESPGVRGLSLLRGRVRRIPETKELKVPNIGWNSLDIVNGGRLFQGIAQSGFVYFVHSYYLDAADKEIVTSQIDYGVRVDASIEKDNIFALQFHPEKSSELGLKILENFLKV